METDPLLHAAAQSLYEHRPEGVFGSPAGTREWRRHADISLQSSMNLAWDKVVSALEAQRWVPAHSEYASRRKYQPSFRLPPEEKILLRQMISKREPNQIVRLILEETVLLRYYEDALKAQTNTLSPHRAAQLAAVKEGLATRGEALAAIINSPEPLMERDNVIALGPRGQAL